MPADSSTTPRAWPTANAEREFWPKKSSSIDTAGAVLGDQVTHLRVDVGQPALERLPRRGVDHAAVERRELAAA